MSSMIGMSGSGRSGNKIPKGYKQGQIQQFTPEQMQLFQQMFSHVGPDSYLSKLAGGDEGIFNQIEAPAMRQFAGMQGNIASRFSGMGSGARRSSGFQNTMNQAGSDFAQDLASRRQQLQQQAIQELMGLSSNLLGQRPYDQFLVEKQQKSNPWSSFASGLGSAIPGAIGGFMMGGPPGAAAGAGMGFASGLSSGGSSGVGQGTSGNYNLPTFLGRQ